MVRVVREAGDLARAQVVLYPMVMAIQAGVRPARTKQAEQWCTLTSGICAQTVRRKLHSLTGVSPDIANQGAQAEWQGGTEERAGESV
eukprot:6858254-Prymnesium_polylepis.1